MNTRISFAFVAVALTALVACGGSDGGDGGTNDAGGGAAATTTVTLRDNTFEPGDPVIAAGSLELVNEGESPHTFTVEDQGVDVEVEAGATASASVDLEPGTYTLFCRFHREQGMEGTLTVEA